MIPVSPYEARKHAKDAPAGPAPMIRKVVSRSDVGVPLPLLSTLFVIEAPFVDAIMLSLFKD